LLVACENEGQRDHPLLVCCLSRPLTQLTHLVQFPYFLSAYLLN
jgi:hypothetical protein